MPNDGPSMVSHDSPRNTPFVLQKGNDPLSARFASVRGLFWPALTYTNTHEVATRPNMLAQSKPLQRWKGCRSYGKHQNAEAVCTCQIFSSNPRREEAAPQIHQNGTMPLGAETMSQCALPARDGLYVVGDRRPGSRE